MFFKTNLTFKYVIQVNILNIVPAWELLVWVYLTNTYNLKQISNYYYMQVNGKNDVFEIANM
jgi:hypothetical protein